MIQRLGDKDSARKHCVGVKARCVHVHGFMEITWNSMGDAKIQKLQIQWIWLWIGFWILKFRQPTVVYLWLLMNCDTQLSMISNVYLGRNKNWRVSFAARVICMSLYLSLYSQLFRTPIWKNGCPTFFLKAIDSFQGKIPLSLETILFWLTSVWFQLVFSFYNVSQISLQELSFLLNIYSATLAPTLLWS